MITIGCILLHRLQGRKLPQTRFSLGKWGILTNTIALLYVTPIFVFSLFPSVPRPNSAEMNWAVLMVGGVVVFASIYYFISGRKQYSPPIDTVEDYIMRGEAGVSEKDVSVEVAEKKLAEDSVEVAEKRLN
jgi:amino acid transporter